jgi:hypothetical protein
VSIRIASSICLDSSCEVLGLRLISRAMHLALEHVFLESANFCEDLTRALELAAVAGDASIPARVRHDLRRLPPEVDLVSQPKASPPEISHAPEQPEATVNAGASDGAHSGESVRSQGCRFASE